MSWHCDVCSRGMVVFLGFETIPEIDADNNPIYEVHSIMECDFCGDPCHTLIRIYPRETNKKEE